MTVSDLYKSVAQLGFEDSLENDTRFLLAANRALLQVNSLRPATGSYTLIHRVPHNLFPISFCDYTIDPPKTVNFSVSGAKACYLELMGEGTISIVVVKRVYNEDEKKWEEEEEIIDNGEFSFSNETYAPYKLFLRKSNAFLDYDTYTGEVKFKFTGDFTCFLRNVAFYKQVLSSDKEKVFPYTKETYYDLSSLIPDLLHVSKPPYMRNAFGEYIPLTDYEIINGTILRFPLGNDKTIIVEYDRRLSEITYPSNGGLDTSNDKVDISEDLAALLPDLIAAYIWLDDEPEKAQFYLSLYQMNVARLEHQKKTFDDALYVSSNGW